LVPQRPGDRIKTDPREARKLGQLHTAGLLEPSTARLIAATPPRSPRRIVMWTASAPPGVDAPPCDHVFRVCARVYAREPNSARGPAGEARRSTEWPGVPKGSASPTCAFPRVRVRRAGGVPPFQWTRRSVPGSVVPLS